MIARMRQSYEGETRPEHSTRESVSIPATPRQPGSSQETGTNPDGPRLADKPHGARRGLTHTHSLK